MAKTTKAYKKLKKQGVYTKAARRRIVALIATLGVVALFSIFSIGRAISNNMETKEILKDKEIELIQMQEKKKLLESELIKLDDPEYVSQYIRDDYYYTAEGEIFFLLPEEEGDVDESTTNNN